MRAEDSERVELYIWIEVELAVLTKSDKARSRNVWLWNSAVTFVHPSSVCGTV